MPIPRLGLTLLVSALCGIPLSAETGSAKEKKDLHSNWITDDKELHELYVKGARQALNWEYETAKKTFAEVIRRDPDNPAGDFLMGALMLNTIQYLDPETTKDDEKQILECFENAIKKADKVLAKDPTSFEANFSKGAAQGFRGLYRLQKLKILGAASDARIAKQCMERSIAANPDFNDAYLGLGGYNYFIDALPAFIRFIKMFLLIPPGNRKKGIEQLTTATEKAVYCSTYAKVILAGIFRNFEGELGKALKLEGELARQCPDHPWYALERGTLYVHSLVDFARGEAAYREVLARSATGHPHFQGEIEAIARYRLAQVKFFDLRPHEAIADLEALIAAKPKEPKEMVAGAHLLLGQIYCTLGQKEPAHEHLRKVKALPDSKTYRHERMDNRVVLPKQQRLHVLADELLRQPVSAERGDTYRRTVEGFADLRAGRVEKAQEKLEQALAAAPEYELAVFGLGETNARLGRFEEALRHFRDLTRGIQTDPPWLLRDARFRAGLLLDRLGRREQALKFYRMAIKAKGGSYFHGEDAERALKEENVWQELGWPER